MHTRYGKLFIAAGLLTAHSFALLPPDAVVIEAESLAPENTAWRVVDHWDNWYAGHPSGGKMLRGENNAKGTASKAFDIPAPGTYNVWVRYLDLDQHKGDPDAFSVAVAQDGKTLCDEVLSKTCLRKTDAGRKKWGAGWGQFVFASVPFTAGKAGPATLTLGRPGTATGGCNVDLFVITSDTGYEADVRDVNPMFLKIKILPEQEKPCIIEVTGRRSSSTAQWYWYFLGLHINRDGWGFHGNMFDAKFPRLEPGQETPWIPLHEQLSFHSRDMIAFCAKSDPGEPQMNAAFELMVSKTPDESGILLKETRKGTGGGLVLNVNLVKGTIVETDKTGSEQSLKWAKATTPVDGSRPALFPFTTGMNLEFNISQGEYVQNELDALKMIGINGLNNTEIVHPDFPFVRDSRFIWHLARAENGIEFCLNNPNVEAIDKHMKDYKPTFEKKTCIALDLMDEPSFETRHIVACDRCAKLFREYTAKQGVPLDGKPAFDPNVSGDDAVRYYWSKRFQAHSMAEFFRNGTETVNKHMPGLPTASNFSTELIFDGNMVNRGTDWYEILRTGALTYGLTEDWNNYTATFQTLGLQIDTLRSACRAKGYPYGIFNIMDGRSGWDITAKGFGHIGHGCKLMFFYNYGPYYAPTCDTASDRAEIYQAIKDITLPTGAVEKHIMDPAAKPAKGDVAMLVGVTSDIWGAPSGDAYGRERIYLHLLLTHCGYRMDVLNEEDLATGLKDYKVLFVTDSHIRRSQLAPLVSWVKAGGTLYLGPGALTFDEYNKPLDADKTLGITRQPMNLVQKGGNAQHYLCHQKPLPAIEGIPPAYIGFQQPVNKTFANGKGKVIFSGFFPGMSYIASSKKASGATAAARAEYNPDDVDRSNLKDIYSARTFEPAYRDYIASLNLPVRPRLYTSNPLVEAGLIESPKADVIVISNWTGEPQTVTVTLDNAKADAKAVTVIGGKKQDAKIEKGALSVKLDMKAGCYVLLPKR